MSKDPAFLFYSSDFLTGTMFMSAEQAGIYIRLLCAQHQHGGLIGKADFDAMVGIDPVIRAKFIETAEGYYNERLREESEKRALYSESRRNNRLSKPCEEHKNDISSTHDRRMENENEDANRDVVDLKDKKKEKIEKLKFLDDVLLTTEEHSRLVEKLGAERAARAIEILDNYKGSKGTKYKSDYKAILNWVIKRLEEDERKSNGTGQQPAPGSYASRIAYRHGPEQDKKFRDLKETFDRRDRERAGSDSQ
jgi:uncharacterized protein YdaU (DUF1376 family)